MTKKSPRKPSPKARSLTVQRVFDATPNTLWACWTDPEKYAKWFNPAPGLDLVVHEYDVRPGGRVRFDMPQPDGNKNPQEGVFHVVTPYREIVSGEPDKSFLVAVRFTPLGKKTRMTVTVTGLPPKYREGARTGWNAGFDKLADLLEDEATSARAIAATRVFDAPRDVVWRMWTEPDQIAQWWGPDGFTNSIDSMDVRPGGVWKFVMHGPDGRDYENEIEYVEVARPERLVYDHGPSPRFRTTVTLVDLGKKTKLTMRAVFSTAAIRDKVAKEYGAVEGGQQTLRRLAEHLARLIAAPEVRREVVLTRTLNAPRERVWEAWTDPDQVKTWWGPKGFTAPEVRIDLRVGGRYVYCMRGMGMDGVVRDFWNTGEHREIVPLEKIVATMSFADERGKPVPASHYDMPGDWPPEVLLTVTFEDAGAGKTRVTVREVGVPEAMAGFAGLGWNQSLDKMAAGLKIPGHAGTAAKGRTKPRAVTEISGRDLVITRVFDAPRRAVWEAWTIPERLTEWWGPKEYTAPACTLDLRVGGRYLFCMRSPAGKDIWSTGVFREVVPQERIVFTDCFADEKGNVVPATYYGMSEDIPLEMLVTVTLEDLKGGTKMVLRHPGFPAGEHVRSAGIGWNGSLDKLERMLTSARRGGRS